jgi:integrase
VVAVATVNRALAALRHLLRIAWKKWGVIPQVPFIELMKEPPGLTRFLDEQEIARLMIACASTARSPVLAGIVTIALNSGMRRGEILGLTWDRVDFSRGVLVLEADHTKSGKGREIPMTQAVNNLLAAMPEPRTGRVFPISSIDESYRMALRDAQITGVNFHSLRHSFASHFMQRGGNLNDLREILGHSNMRMTIRYAHLSPGHLRGQMERMNGITGTSGADYTTPTQEIAAPSKFALLSRR